MRRTAAVAMAFFGGLLAAACSSPDHPAARYDFGAPPPPATGASTAVASPAGGATGLPGVYVQVFEPSWLDTAAIVYRLGYDDSDRVQSYALSQWVAAPAGLLQQRLRAQLGLEAVPVAFAGTAAGSPASATAGSPASAKAGTAAGAVQAVQPVTLLRVDLDEFDQIFDTPQSSRVRLRAQASLVDVVHGVVRAQRRFSIERAAPSPDALGAVHGLRDAVDTFAADVQAWARTVVVAP